MFENTDFAPADVGLSRSRLEAIGPYFDRNYLQSGKLPCMALLVSRNGEVAYEDYRGTLSFDDETPIGPDTIFRIYSMTKPVTAVAAMMLYEEGHFRLDEPLSRFIPDFADVEVWDGGSVDDYSTRKPDRPITLKDVFTHMSGVTYAFLNQTPVDALYRREQIGRIDETLEAQCKRIAALPLLFSPGTHWNYGHSTDLLGRVVEVVSGQTLDTFFQKRIFEPLGMTDTGFYVPQADLERLAACYARDPVTKQTQLVDGAGEASRLYRSKPPLKNAGGGLVGTIRDYYKFCLMLLRGGSLNGTTLLSPKTVEFMRLNHLPGGATIKALGDKTFSEARMEGHGFGLLGGVVTNVADTLATGSVGSYSWGGLANTFFWIDPAEELIVVQATQMMPTGTYPIRPQLQQLVYGALEW